MLRNGRTTTIAWTTWPSPLGTLWLAATVRGICALDFEALPTTDGNWVEDPEPFRDAMEALGAYFGGIAVDFGHLRLDLRGTPFQLEVWSAVRSIPYGETRSYSHVAQAIGRPRAARAVGAAVAANPVSLLVPCHRVVGTGGNLVGYGGGLQRKAYLLALERRGCA